MPRTHSGRFARAALVVSFLLCAAAARAQSGVLDPTFATDGVAAAALGTGDDFGRALAIQDDDRIVVAGTCNLDDDDFCVLRFALDGTLDASFDGDGKLSIPIRSGIDEASAVVLQADQKILLAGFSRQGSKDELALARVLANGTLDPSFDGDGKLTTAIGTLADQARAVAVQTDGKIVAAGFTLTASNRDLALVRYDEDGSLDPAFSGDGKVALGVGTGDDEAAAIAIQPDGKIVVAGYAADGSQHDLLIARFLDNGSLDPDFNAGGTLRVDFGAGNAFGNAVALQSDGKIVVAGYARVGTVFNFAIVRVDENGVLDPMLDGDGKLTTAIGSTSQASAIALDGTGRFAVAGLARVAGNDDIALARYNVDGSLDGNFAGTGFVTLAAGSGPDAGNAVAVQGDGKIVVAGSARNGNDDDVAIARYLLDDCGNGVLDTGEACDGGALIDGDCCSTACAILPAATLCRPVADVCDIVDFCDGASGVCPEARLPDGDDDGVCDDADLCPDAPDPAQGDGDDDGLGDACDPCTSGVAVAKPKIKITKYGTGPGDDTFSFTGSLDFAAAPILDPLARGARVILEDGTGATIFDVAIPAGAYGPATRTGWLVNGASTAFTFRSAQAIGGVLEKMKLSRTTARPDLVKFTMSGKRGGYATAPVAMPLAAVVVLDPPTAATGECGEIAFPGPPPALACTFNRSGSTLSCK